MLRPTNGLPAFLEGDRSVCSINLRIGSGVGASGECLLQLLGRLIPLPGVLLEATVDDPPEFVGKFGLECVDPWWYVAEDRRDDLRRAVGIERVVPGGHAVEDRPQREDVGPVVSRLTLELLGGHVGGGAQDLAVTGQKVGFHQRIAAARGGVDELHLGKTEIENLEVAVAVHHDVAGFEIPVGHASCVGRFDGIDERHSEPVKLGRRQPVIRYETGENLSVDVLHSEEVEAVGLLHREDGDDVGVIEIGDD